MVVLNKVDLVTPTHVEVVREWVDHHFNRVRIIEAVNCEVPYEILLSCGRFDPSAGLSEHIEAESNEGCPGSHCTDPSHDHGSGRHTAKAGDIFQTWSFTTDLSMSSEALMEIVKRKLPASVFRCKGIIWSSNAPNRRQSLQAVGRRTAIKSLDAWGERPQRTQIVAIGRDIPVGELEALFSSATEKDLVA